MKKKMRARWYCDFCGRGSGSAPGMQKHEQGCTMNPDRACGMCREAALAQAPIAELVAVLAEDLDDPHGLFTDKAGLYPGRHPAERATEAADAPGPQPHSGPSTRRARVHSVL